MKRVYAAGQSFPHTPNGLRFLPWLLVALTPAFFVLTTWEPGGVRIPATDWPRLFGLPVVGIELVVVSMAFFLRTKPLQPLRRLPSWACLVLVALVGIGIYSALTARMPFISLCWTLIAIVHVLFGLAVYGLTRELDDDHERLIWPAIAAGIGIYFLLFALFACLLPHPSNFDWEKLRFGTTNIRHLGHYAVVGAAAALALAVSHGGRRMVIYASFATAMFGVAFWSGTRGAILAVIVATIVASLLSPMLRSPRAWLILAGSIAAGALLSLLIPAPNHILGIGRMTAATHVGSMTSGRMDLWASTWSAILHRPVFGYGAGQFMWVVPAANGAFYHPHNIVLQLLLQWGFVGTALTISLLGHVAWTNRRALDAPDAPATAALLVGLSILVLSAADGALFFAYPTMMFAFSAALLLGNERRRYSATNRQTERAESGHASGTLRTSG